MAGCSMKLSALRSKAWQTNSLPCRATAEPKLARPARALSLTLEPVIVTTLDQTAPGQERQRSREGPRAGTCPVSR